MLLVHHDKAEAAEGEPQSRARADHRLRPALGDGAPGLAPLPRAELGMPERRIDPETRAEAREPLGAERDLRQHHQHLPAGVDGSGHRLEIDLGLARAGHPVEDGDREGGAGDRSAQAAGGAVLRRGEGGAGPGRIGPAEGRDLRRRDRLDRPLGGQSAHHAGAHPGRARDLRRGAGRPVAQQREHPAPRLGHARSPSLPELPGGTHRRGLQRGGDAHAQAQHRPPLCQRVVGGPVDQAAQRPGHRRRLQQRRHRLEAGRLDIARARAPDHADTLAAGERHAHEAAGRERVREVARHGIVVSLIQRQRQQDGDAHGRARPIAARGAAHGPRPAAARWKPRMGHAKRPPHFTVGPAPSRIAGALFMLSSCITPAAASSPMTAAAGAGRRLPHGAAT